MSNWGVPDEPIETDEIWPVAEGGPRVSWNQRRIARSENRSKGAEMPDVFDVLVSPDPTKLATKIDERSLRRPFRNSRNKDKGFGGLPRR
jgi:hypothetical protein